MDIRTAQTEAVVALALIVADAIRELGTVPSGHLYAHLMGRMTFASYTALIEILKESGLVTESAHVLKWVGPAHKPESDA